jgi:hypothetical protein
MILAADTHGRYFACLGADLIDHAGIRYAVGNHTDVLKILLEHPDTEFTLMTQGIGRAVASPDLATAAICGNVRWNSEAKEFVNTAVPLHLSP